MDATNIDFQIDWFSLNRILEKLLVLSKRYCLKMGSWKEQGR